MATAGLGGKATEEEDEGRPAACFFDPLSPASAETLLTTDVSTLLLTARACFALCCFGGGGALAFPVSMIDPLSVDPMVRHSRSRLPDMDSSVSGEKDTCRSRELLSRGKGTVPLLPNESRP